MATQAALIADTVAGMRRVVADHHDSKDQTGSSDFRMPKANHASTVATDSDDSFYRPTNRGNKLKRKAQYVREGHLDMPNGPKVYKRVLSRRALS